MAKDCLMTINGGYKIDGDTYFYRHTRKRQTATTLEQAGPRQFDTVYGKHISLEITSWGKQAAQQASKQD